MAPRPRGPLVTSRPPQSPRGPRGANENLEVTTMLAPRKPPTDAFGRPYFLWSEDMTEDEFRRVLAGERGPAQQALYTGRLLREARLAEIWYYLTPQQVADRWQAATPHLGRMREFWLRLLEAWRDAGRVSWQP